MTGIQKDIKKKIDLLDERSDEVKEILGRAPNWVIRSGISVVFLVVLVLILGAVFISYNDIIPAQIIITSKNPPVYLKANTAGRVTNVFVEPNQQIEKDYVLAEIENTAKLSDIVYLKNKLANFTAEIGTLDTMRIIYPSILNLGRIQLEYEEFLNQYQNYILFNALSLNEKKSTMLRKQQLDKAHSALNNELLLWEKQFLIKSPIRGRVAVFDIWNQYQNVDVGETLFTVVPNDLEGIIGRATLPIRNSGKVKIGQRVIIKLANYPFEEWGSLEGEIKNISEVPKQGEEAFYTLYIKLEGLTTTYNKQIDFKPEMQGTAEIVIEELTILQRIFYQLRKAFNKV